MSAGSGPILFEAVCTPPRSLSRRGLRLIGAAFATAAAVTGLLFALLGAWPVLGFLGLEVVLVVGLLSANLRWSSRAVEMVVLTEDALRVIRTDGRGRREEARLEPYWTRVEARREDGEGAIGALVLRQRGREVEIGRYLSEGEKRHLAEALTQALRRYRNPVFDNPQLRD